MSKANLKAMLRFGVSPYDGPSLIFDLSALEARFRRLGALEVRFRMDVRFAVKSFPWPEVLHLAAKHVAGFDVSNAAELEMVPPARVISLTNPVLRLDALPDLRRKANQAVVYLECAEDLAVVDWVPAPVLVGLRLSPATLRVAANTEAGDFSRFGADGVALAALKTLDAERFSGFLVHYGGEQTADDIITYARGMVALARAHGLPLRSANLGGGLAGVGLDALEPLCAALRSIVPTETTLVLEPGEICAEDTGLALGRVMSVRRYAEGWIATIDLSRELHLQWTRPQILHAGKGPAEAPVRIFGPTCYERDYFGTFRIPVVDLDTPPYARDQWVGFTGINGYAAALNHGFNGIAPARVVVAHFSPIAGA